MALVLLVDDHAVIAFPLKMALEASGFGPVVTADPDDLSAEAVLAAAGSLRPDIVLLDLHLGRDRLGLPMLEPLIQLGAKVILFTATTDPRLIARSLRAGALAVIDKATPFHGWSVAEGHRPHRGDQPVDRPRPHRPTLSKLGASSQREALALARAAGWPPDG